MRFRKGPAAAAPVVAVPTGHTDNRHIAGQLEDTIDLPHRTVSMRIGKADEWVEFPLHEEVFELLAAIPEPEPKGRLFP